MNLRRYEMKITKVDVMQVKTPNPSWRPILCRVYTDEGIYGDGEAALAYGIAAPAAFGMIPGGTYHRHGPSGQ